MREHVNDGEVPGLIAHLRIEQHLQQQIAQFLAQVVPVLALDRVQHLVGLFQGVFADGGKALLAVPGTATGSAQPCHDCHAFLKQCAGVRGLAAVLLAHATTLTDVGYRTLWARTMPYAGVPRLAILPLSHDIWAPRSGFAGC